MTNIKLEKQNIKDWSDIQVTFHTGDSTITKYRQILVISYAGEYGVGCEGNGDAQYMYAMGKFGIELYEPAGIIIDFRELEYVWGDMLEMVFGLGCLNYHPHNVPNAMIVGDKCQEAIGTLIHGLDSKEPPTTEDWIFGSLEEAWKFVEEGVELESAKYRRG
jgi:hypothetical protein